MLGAFFEIKALQTAFLPKFLTCPKKLQKQTQSPKKKRLHFHFGCHFCKIKAHTAILRWFSYILPKFPHVFLGF